MNRNRKRKQEAGSTLTPATAGGQERLHKAVARTGKGSRRQVEAWITEGRISVDGSIAHLGQKIGPGARVCLDGRALDLKAAAGASCRVLLYRKPAGEVVSRRDPQGRDTVFRNLPSPGSGRWIAVGRLDINTSGLLLFTNDGELAKRLMHPRYCIEREYAVRVYGQVTPSVIERMQAGVELEDGIARFDRIKTGAGSHSNQWFYVILHEGRQRVVRRLWESQGVTVSRLIRVGFGTCAIPRGTRVGSAYELSAAEMRPLLALVGLAASRTETGRGMRTTR